MAQNSALASYSLTVNFRALLYAYAATERAAAALSRGSHAKYNLAEGNLELAGIAQGCADAGGKCSKEKSTTQRARTFERSTP